MSNELDHDTRYLLGLLQEEAAEIIQAASKMLRFGPFSRNPTIVDDKTNIQNLHAEIGDMYAIVQLLIDRERLLDKKMIDDRSIIKQQQIKAGIW